MTAASKNKPMKKFLLSLIGVLFAVPTFSRDFQYEYDWQTLTYTVLDEDAKTVAVAAYNQVSGELVLPTKPKEDDKEYTLTNIGRYAFSNCSSLISVVIPNSVISIGNRAFQYCESLTTVTIPNSVTSIDDWAFSYCDNLATVTIPNSVTSICDYVFFYCGKLTSVEIPNSVTSIGMNAFMYCSSLTSVEIPNSVKSIGKNSFF